MLGWWGKGKPPIVEREPLVEEARKELATISQWDLPTRTSFSVFLASLWREFMDDFGGPTGFAQSPRDQQLSFFKSIYERWLFFGDQIDRLRHNRAEPPQVWDAIAQMYAARLLSYYLLAIFEGKEPWEKELASQLDEFLEVAGSSWGAFRAVEAESNVTSSVATKLKRGPHWS